MRDVDIRRVLDAGLREGLDETSNAEIRHELGVCAGRRRVDVALIDEHLEGWEIKSDHDSLARLPGQVAAYSSVLDRSWLVVTDRHLSRAANMVPPWWGLVRASEVEGTILLKQLRRPKRSPQLCAMATAQLLWREEALDLLKDRGMARGLSSKARWYVWERLAATFAEDELRRAVRESLRARRDWPGGQQRS